MTDNKTGTTAVGVDEFISGVASERRRTEAGTLRDMMERITGEKATMWGRTIVGFGNHHYKYASGREGDTFVVGFAPRAAAITLYGLYDAYGEPDPNFDGLGPHTTGKGCLYIKRLDDVDLTVLEKIVASKANSTEA